MPKMQYFQHMIGKHCDKINSFLTSMEESAPFKHRNEINVNSCKKLVKMYTQDEHVSQDTIIPIGLFW